MTHWLVTVAFRNAHYWLSKSTIRVSAGHPAVAAMRAVKQAKAEQVRKGTRVEEVSIHLTRVPGGEVS